MKKYLFLLFLIISKNFLFAQNQLEINQKANKDYLKTDKELNLIYQKILKDYKDDKVFIKNLKIAQKAWIQFRDAAEMKMKFPDREEGYYGSIQPLCWNNYLEFLTKERIKTLQVWLTGIDEGDACNGTVKNKE